MTESSISPQEPARPLLSDDEMPLYVLSIQERAELLASQFEGKPAGPQVTFPHKHRHLIDNPIFIHFDKGAH